MNHLYKNFEFSKFIFKQSQEAGDFAIAEDQEPLMGLDLDDMMKDMTQEWEGEDLVDKLLKQTELAMDKEMTPRQRERWRRKIERKLNREERRAERALNKANRQMLRAERKVEKLLRKAGQAFGREQKDLSFEKGNETEQVVIELKSKLISKIEEWNQEGLDQSIISDKIKEALLNGSLAEEAEKAKEVVGRKGVEMNFKINDCSYKIKLLRNGYSMSYRQSSLNFFD